MVGTCGFSPVKSSTEMPKSVLHQSEQSVIKDLIGSLASRVCPHEVTLKGKALFQV